MSGAKAAPVSAPLPPVVAQRVARQAGYEKSKEEVAKWQPIVKVRPGVHTYRIRICILKLIIRGRFMTRVMPWAHTVAAE